jgi:DNA end-binding protein Ku
MARPIWKGVISFGLVNVPVTLYSAEQRADLSFKLIDSRNSARIRYERVNEATGDEVPWDKIVKGYEFDGGNYVLLSNEELASASAELTKTIEIEQFVDLDAIDPVAFDKPYYLVPAKGGEKGYVLLREAMRESGRVGIAQVVIRSRGHLAALLPRADALILDLLRYRQELRAVEEYDLPTGTLKDYKISRKELDLAGQLIEGMTSEWKPEQYEDEYRKAVLALIEKRIKSGEIEHVSAEEEPAPEAPRTVNFMDVLKQSVQKTGKPAARKSTRKRPARKKRAS